MNITAFREAEIGRVNFHSAFLFDDYLPNLRKAGSFDDILRGCFQRRLYIIGYGIDSDRWTPVEPRAW